MEFRVLTRDNVELVREWRNKCLEALRTPYFLTGEQQQQFYDDVICNRNVKARFWGIWMSGQFIGMTGLENIEWENSCAEISLIINPEHHGKGYGNQAVDMLLDKGFNYLGLETIYGECYDCNPSIEFWKKIIEKYSADTAILPNRKLWNGSYHDSLYFSFDVEEYLCRKLS
jgi:RimJ/RimL family protein N-acetyltransferase